jgi:hypothetical protein
MQFLASDALRGRGSGTEDELLAAMYVASELERAGVEPAGSPVAAHSSDLTAFLQPVNIGTRTIIAPPQLSFTAGDRTVNLIHGQDFYVARMSAPEISGTLQHNMAEASASAGRHGFVLSALQGEVTQQQIRSELDALPAKAAALLLPMPARIRNRVQSNPSQLPSMAPGIEGAAAAAGEGPIVIYLEPVALQQLRSLPDGTSIMLKAETSDSVFETRNVVGVVRGSDPKLADQAILLSAHLDHLGVGSPVNGDAIYNGADDDASGVSAVLELARALAREPRPRRTVIFALFGSEEKGLWGSTYYRSHPTVPLANIVANLAFEMIARPDVAVAPNALWLTGWDRSNLGPELAQHGARLVADPHPEQHFFQRSDNYALAQRGVVAQTVSSYGLHHDYHQPSDELSKVDWDHLAHSISSMIGPLRWLANSDFQPRWREGKKP